MTLLYAPIEPYDSGLLEEGLDLASPLVTAWELSRAWPAAELKVIETAGHIGNDATKVEVVTALRAFARR